MKISKKRITVLIMIFVIALYLSNVIEGKAAEKDWEFSLYPRIPLDRVEYDIKDENHKNAVYFVGYRKGKVAIMNEKYQMVAQTDYDEVMTKEVRYGDVCEVYANTYYKGQVALVVRKNRSYGLCDLQGRELLPCQYKEISFEESLKGHGLFTLTKKNGNPEIWVDGVHRIKNVNYPFLIEYEGEVCIFDYDLETGGYYRAYDLTGKELGKVDAYAIIHSPKGEFWDLDWYKSACDNWLTEECKSAEEKAAAYYESLGYLVESVSSYTTYNYVKDRKEQMYYYIVVKAELGYETADVKKTHLATSDYLFMYTADRNLRIEGQTNLMESDRLTDEPLMLDVLILSKDGVMQCMDRYTGEIRELYTMDPKTIFCDKNSYTLYGASVFKRYHLKGVAEEREYTKSYTYNYTYDTRTYTLDYTRDYLAGIGEDNTIYVLTTGEKINYDWYQGGSVYGITINESETQMYYITDRIIPINKVQATADVLNQFAYSCPCYPLKDSVFLICYATKEIFFVNEKECISWSYEELGIQRDEIVLRPCKFWYDNLGFFEIMETRYDQTPYIHHYFAANLEGGRIKFLGSFDTVPKLIESSDSSNSLGSSNYVTIGSVCYLYKNGTLYTIDMEQLTVTETDLSNIFNEGTIEEVASIDEINGKPYIRYKIPRNEDRDNYGYMDIQGNKVIDAAAANVYFRETNPIYMKCTQYENYLRFGEVLFDLDFHEITRDIQVVYLEEFDEATGLYQNNGMVNVYNRYNGDKFLGFMYDTKKGKIVKQYEKLTEVYKRLTGYGNYYEALLSETEEIAWVNKDTMEELGRGEGYCYVDEKNQVYTIFKKKGKSKNTVLAQNCCYKINGGVYQITSVKNKTAAFVGASCTAKKYTIPDTVKIAGKSFRVTAINPAAFSGNKKLTKVVIGKNVEKVGKNAFLNCKKLKTIIVKGVKLKAVGGSALKGTGKSVVITVPSEKKNVYKNLWKGKGNSTYTIK